jgi:hypothetical protein
VEVTGPVWFNVREARAHLLRHGYVFTLRRPRGVGPAEARWGNRRAGPTRSLGPVLVTLIDPAPSRQVLEYHVGASGFRTVDDWLGAAAPGSTRLYLVTRALRIQGAP